MTIKKQIIIEVDNDDAKKALAQMAEGVNDTSDEVKGLEEDIEDVGKSAKKSESKLKGMSKAAKAVGTALKAAGIGLIIALFAKLSEIASKNQKVMDFFSNTMKSLEIIFRDVFNFVSNDFLPLFQRVKDFFSNLTFKDVGQAIKDNLIERFQSLLDVFGYVGDAIRALIARDWDAMKEAAKNAGKEFVDVATGVDNSFDKITETAKNAANSVKNYASETWGAARAMTELNNQAQLAEVINKGIFEQYDRQAEQLRQLRDDDRNTIEDRIRYNEELLEVLAKQEQLMLSNAEIAIQAAQNELALNNNLENRIKLQEALNEKAAIQAQVEGFRSEQIANQVALLRERDDAERDYYENIEDEIDAYIEEQEKADKEITESANKANEDRLKNEENVQQAKLGFASTTSNLIGQIVDEDSKAGKAIAIGQATIAGIESVQNAFTTAQKSPLTLLNPSYPFIQAGIAGAFSLLQLNKIKSSNPVGGSGGAVGQQGASAPSFNLVQGTGTNQIAESLAQSSEPVKAFVVSSDVSTSQELDRKIVEGASI